MGKEPDVGVLHAAFEREGGFSSAQKTVNTKSFQYIKKY
jgi:hypothetical protein